MPKMLFAPITKTTQADDGSLTVEGYASSDQPDSEGDTITADAMRNALPEYMKFGAVREMHQLSAVGTALHAEVGNDGRTSFKAQIVDPMAVKKVKENVYKGFSIGANTLSREGKTITGIRLVEVSLVDAPTNPEAVITMYKAQEVGMPGTEVVKADDPEKDKKDKEAADKRAADEAKKADDVEKAAEADDEQKAAKAEGGEYGSHEAAGYADPGYQDDKKPRYPLKNDGKWSDERIRAAWNYIHMAKNKEKYTSAEVKRIEGRIVRAWKEAIDEKGPPEAEEKKADDTKKTTQPELTKGMRTVAAAAQVLQQLDTIRQIAQQESKIEGDGSKVPGMLEEAMKQFAEAFTAMAEEEAKEIVAGTDDNNQGYNQVMYYATRQPEIIKAGRRHSKADLERMTKIVDLLKEMGHSEDDEEVKTMRAKMADAEKADDAEKTEKSMVPGLIKTMETNSLLKAMGAQLQSLGETVHGLKDENDLLKAQVTKLGETPLPPKGSLLAVTKTTETGGVGQEDAINLIESIAIRDREGNIQKTATAIKLLQRTGGQPLLTGLQRPEGRGNEE